MKKLIMFFLMLTMLVFVTACSDAATDSDVADGEFQQGETMSDEDYESIAAMALLREISTSYLSDSVDAGSSTFEVSSVDSDSFGAKIYGTITLYDKYGKVYGDYRREFTVTLDSDGDVRDCNIR